MRKTARAALIGLAGLVSATMLASPAGADPTAKSPKDDFHYVSNDGSIQYPEVVGPVRGKPKQKSSPSFAGTGSLSGVSGVEFAPLPEGSAVPDTSALEAEVSADLGLEVGADKVIGEDTRYAIVDTTRPPFNQIVYISYVSGGKSWRCSGWLYGPRDVATAGHCLYDKDLPGNEWSQQIVVTPGRYGSTAPFGSCGASRIVTNSVWAGSEDYGYDYGYIRLSCNVGNATGWFGLRGIADSATDELATVTGYPGDRSGYTMWQASERVYDSFGTHVYYQTDTAAGQSGGPVWNDRTSCGNCVIAIHNVGLASDMNHGVRITNQVFNALMTWKNDA